MTKYKCGHERDGVIIFDEAVQDFEVFYEWLYSVGTYGSKKMCWDCYQQEINRLINNIKTVKKTANTISITNWK